MGFGGEAPHERPGPVQVEPVASHSRRRYAGCSSPEDADGVDDAPGAERAGAELGRSQVEVLGEEGVAVQRCSAGLEQPASRLTGARTRTWA